MHYAGQTRYSATFSRTTTLTASIKVGTELDSLLCSGRKVNDGAELLVCHGWGNLSVQIAISDYFRGIDLVMNIVLYSNPFPDFEICLEWGNISKQIANSGYIRGILLVNTALHSNPFPDVEESKDDDVLLFQLLPKFHGRRYVSNKTPFLSEHAPTLCPYTFIPIKELNVSCLCVRKQQKNWSV